MGFVVDGGILSAWVALPELESSESELVMIACEWVEPGVL